MPNLVLRASKWRLFLGALVALLVGGALALGTAGSAWATSGQNFTVLVTTKAGAPLTGVTIFAEQVKDGHEAPGDPDVVAKPVAHQAGFYSFTGASQLLTGVTYTLAFYPAGSITSSTYSQFLGGATVIDRARTFVVGTDAGEITSLSTSLATNATIAGIVKGPSGAVVKGAKVEAYFYNGSDWYFEASAVTAATGKYLLTDLEPGSYKLEVRFPGGLRAPVYSGGAASLDDATPLSIALGTTTSENVSFPNYTGAIKGSSQFQFEDIGWGYLAKAVPAAYPVTAVNQFGRVTAISSDNATYGAPASSHGAWSVKGLAPGDYVVRLFPWYYNEPADYVNYGGGADSLDGATIWHVTASTVDAGFSDFGISGQGGSLKVTVVDSANAAVSGANVLLQRSNDTDEFYQGTTASNGTVTFGISSKHSVIRPGDFTVDVVDPDGSSEPSDQTYDITQGSHQLQVKLAPRIAAPGFSAGPAISQTSTSVGTTYTVTATAARADADLSYQWLRDDRPIYGADGASYTSRVSDIGTQLSVRVGASSFGFNDVYSSASVQGIVTTSEEAPQLVSPPTITPADGSTVHAGTVLHASPGVWSVDGLDYAYQWSVGGATISDTGTTYVVTADDIGKAIGVTVSPSKVGYPTVTPVDATNTVTPTQGPATTPIVVPTVTSTTKAVAKGSARFTVAPGSWTGLDPQFSYQWRLGNLPIGTNSPTYVEVESKANLLQPLTVEVSAVVAGFEDGSAVQTARRATIAATASVQPTGSLKGSGVALAATDHIAVGQTVVVGAGGLGTWAGPTVITGDPETYAYTYQWYRASGTAAAKAIAGATSASYAPTTSSIGYKLSFVETAHSSLWATAVSKRISVGTIAPATELVDVSGAVSASLPTDLVPSGAYVYAAVDTDAWTADGAAITFQWYGCAPASCAPSSPTSAFTLLSGQREAAIVFPASVSGGRAFLRVTATKAGFATAHVDSPVVPIAAKNILLFAGTPALLSVWSTPATPAVGENMIPTFTNLQVADSTVLKNVQTVYAVQVCSADCESADATWQTASGATSFGEFASYVPNAADWANGDGWVRVYESITATGYLPAVTTSAPEKIEQGSYQPTYFERAQFVQTDGDDANSTTFSVTAPNIFGVTPTIQWYEGMNALGGASQVVQTPNVLGTPEYAVVTYDIPGYTSIHEVLVARGAPAPTVTPVANSIVGNRYPQTLAPAVANPWVLPDYPGVTPVVSYTWCYGQGGGQCSVDMPATFQLRTYDIGNGANLQITYSSPLYPATLYQYLYLPGVVLPGKIDDSAPATQLSWDGALIPGTAVTVSHPNFSPDGVATAYQWQSSDDGTSWTNIVGATSDTYVPTLTDPGKQLRAVVTGTKVGYADSVETSDAEAIHLGDVILDLSAPVVAGDPRVGGLLTVDPGGWSHDVTLHVQWLLDGAPIPGATGDTHIPLSSNLGDEISVRVTASRAGQLDVSAESNRMTVAEASAPSHLTPSKITGKGTVVSPLSVSTGSWSVGGLDYTYQWSDAGGPIAGATTNTLVLPLGDTVASVSVTITATRDGYAAAVVTV